MEAIHAIQSVGISELKFNPTAVIENADGGAVAILNRNKPVAYLLLTSMKRCSTGWKTMNWPTLSAQGRTNCWSRSIFTNDIPLRFRLNAEKEWRKLDAKTRRQFAKKLDESLENPKVPASWLHGMKDCYKGKLRIRRYRLSIRYRTRL
jgi:mRNA-degrading endonuclease RelE of RelBE toxin-antitoxin system